jgi:hypothetical protein
MAAVAAALMGHEVGADVAFSSMGTSVSGRYQWPSSLSPSTWLGWAFTPRVSGQVSQMRTRVLSNVTAGLPVRLELSNESGG